MNFGSYTELLIVWSWSSSRRIVQHSFSANDVSEDPIQIPTISRWHAGAFSRRDVPWYLFHFRKGKNAEIWTPESDWHNTKTNPADRAAGGLLLLSLCGILLGFWLERANGFMTFSRQYGSRWGHLKPLAGDRAACAPDGISVRCRHGACINPSIAQWC